LLELRGVNVFYGNLQALWDVSLEVGRGEVVSLVGPNGAGKTTTLKTIIGLLGPAAGAILFEGQEIGGLPAYQVVERGISLVPEGRMVFPEMTVQENLELGAFPRRSRSQLRESQEWVYQLFPVIGERKGQLAGTLSGGEQQMLVIGRALMSRPLLLMLDEPSLGLSPLLTAEVFRLVERIRKEGVTILLVEQNVFQALEVSDRAYVLETGRIVMAGESSQLLGDERLRASYLGI
jgi:branched-chain amino acid transport system ATP-binding protein